MDPADWAFLGAWMGLPSLLLGLLAYCGWRGWTWPIRAFALGLAAGIAVQVWQGPPEPGRAAALHNSLLLVGVALLMAGIACHMLGRRQRLQRGT